MAKDIKEQQLLKSYVELCKKLGKMASNREVKKFICSQDKYERLFVNMKGLQDAAIELCPSLEQLETPSELVLADIEAYRLGLETKRVKSSNRNFVENVSSLEYIQKFADNVFSGRVKGGKKKSKRSFKRANVLLISDIHVGACIDKATTGVETFDNVEEARRLAVIFKETADYKREHRKDSKLIINLLGDLIENNLHDARTGCTLAEQICRAIHLLLQGITYLANHYDDIEIYCQSGNHDRSKIRHHDRAVHEKFDGHGTVIYYALQAACKNLKNVKFHIPKTPFSTYKVFGNNFFVTHGDTVISNLGGVYSTIKIKDLQNQINKINASLPDKEEFKVFAHGHLHLAYFLDLPNGTALVGNGGLPPPDDFAVSIGNFEGNASQTIFESTAENPVGDYRLIKPNLAKFRNDPSLLEIIKPFVGFSE